MLIRKLNSGDKVLYERMVDHPLQSWGWGEFRKKTKVKVIRVGAFEGKKLVKGYQVTIHPIPKTKYNVGYFPKGPIPDDIQIKILREIGSLNNCIMIKMEPNVGAKVREGRKDAHRSIENYLFSQGCRIGRSLFTKYTFQLNVTKSLEQLLAQQKSKTRYNARLAKRRGVVVREDNSQKAFNQYLELLGETTKRQKFYAHTPDYHRKMWQILNKEGMAKLLTARWESKLLVAWVVFLYKGVLYYPYGASSNQHRELMASNLMMWEVIKKAKQWGAVKFDMWGSLGPDPNSKDPWFGFHKFKEGYGGDLIEFLGSYDLVIKPKLYPWYRRADWLRWKYLRIKACYGR